MNPYRKRIFAEVEKILINQKPFINILDFGSGDGWFSEMFLKKGFSSDITSLDIKKRHNCHIDTILYDGENIPFPNKYFELSFTSDVIHHSHNPQKVLREILRCTKRGFLIKDHTLKNNLDFLTLCLLDIIGNSLPKIDCPFNYQKEFEWFKTIEEEGFELKKIISPLECHVRITGRLTNHLQFLSFWERMN